MSLRQSQAFLEMSSCSLPGPRPMKDMTYCTPSLVNSATALLARGSGSGPGIGGAGSAAAGPAPHHPGERRYCASFPAAGPAAAAARLRSGARHGAARKAGSSSSHSYMRRPASTACSNQSRATSRLPNRDGFTRKVPAVKPALVPVADRLQGAVLHLLQQGFGGFRVAFKQLARCARRNLA